MSNARQKAALPKVTSQGLVPLGIMFLVSGSVGLLYEAAWQREFTLLFGSSAPATAAVLAAYFAGLGLGSFLFGKYTPRVPNPLGIYGLLEIIVGCGALLVAPILSKYGAAYPTLVEYFGASPGILLLAKGLGAFLAIAIPTLAMGGTLPVLAQLFTERREHLGELAGWLYLVNTVGAACGVIAFPFFLELLGMEGVTKSCAVLNWSVGSLALLLSRKRLTPLNSKPSLRPDSAGVSRFLFLAFLSGFVIFVLQVGWNRAFAQIHENSVYSFSFVVAIFIAAIALGAQLARALLRKKTSPKTILGGVWLIGGFLTMAAPFVFFKTTNGLKYSAASAFGSNLIVPTVLSVFVPVIFLSAGLPLILQQAANASKRSTGDLTGMIFGANIIGVIGGTLAGGFLLPSTWGLWGTIIVAGAIAAAAGAFLAAKAPGKRICLLVAPILVGGLALKADLPRTRIDSNRGEKLLALAEGTHGVVAVVERSGSRRLKLNNHYVLGGTAAIGDERMQAHIPLLLHPHPRNVAFLGYGTGITAGTVSLHPVNEPVAVELVPEVVQLAARYFSETNRDGQRAPRVVIEDARNFLRGTKERFDVIVGDLVVPWRHGEGALYTLEQFSIARECLAPDGLYCAWLPMFQLSADDFDVIVRTFQTVFSNVSVWRGDFSPTEPAVALVGSTSEHVALNTVQRRLGETSPDRFNPQLKYARAFWMHFIGIAQSNPEARNQSTDLNTENRPVVELRRATLKPFVGRELQRWEEQLGRHSAKILETRLAGDALAGWEAGRLMREFTLLTVERKREEAAVAQQRVRNALGEDSARSVFGE